MALVSSVNFIFCSVICKVNFTFLLLLLLLKNAVHLTILLYYRLLGFF